MELDSTFCLRNRLKELRVPRARPDAETRNLSKRLMSHKVVQGSSTASKTPIRRDITVPQLPPVISLFVDDLSSHYAVCIIFISYSPQSFKIHPNAKTVPNADVVSRAGARHMQCDTPPPPYRTKPSFRRWRRGEGGGRRIVGGHYFAINIPRFLALGFLSVGYQSVSW